MSIRDSREFSYLEPDSRDPCQEAPFYLYLGYPPVHYTYHYTPAQ